MDVHSFVVDGLSPEKETRRLRKGEEILEMVQVNLRAQWTLVAMFLQSSGSA